MKILMFTPAVKASAIGRATVLIVKELTRNGHNITVIRTESDNFLQHHLHDFGTLVLYWKDLEIGDFQNYEVVIYQIGNNYSFHQGGLYWLEKVPGIVCLHDFFLGHFFWESFDSKRDKAIEILEYWYGHAASKRFFSVVSSEEFLEKMPDLAPMTEWICSMALGVITHSNWGLERVKSCNKNVTVSSLPYDINNMVVKFDKKKRNRKINLITIGHINPNKRVESVIRAIGSNEQLKKEIIYKVVGAIQDDTKKTLSNLANSLGVEVIISGAVDDNTLAKIITRSDVVSCLRWPVLEAASASAIEVMLYGKVVICTDAGFYSELPDDCVLKVSLDNEINEIAIHLKNLLNNKNQRIYMGDKAKAWAQKTFKASNYVNALMDMTKQIAKINPSFYFCEQINANYPNKTNDQTLANLSVLRKCTDKEKLFISPVANAAEYYSKILNKWVLPESFGREFLNDAEYLITPTKLKLKSFSLILWRIKNTIWKTVKRFF